MDLQDAGTTVTHLIRDRDSKYTRASDAVFEAEGIEILTTGIRVPRMNSIMERWVQTCRHELLDRTLIWNLPHLLPRSASSSRSTTSTGLTEPCTARHPCGRFPNRSPNQTDSTDSMSIDATDSSAPCTSTHMPPELRGRNNRHPQDSVARFFGIG
jgi:transposase InsO family protein